MADVLERFYCDAPALADPDGEGIFTIPELVVLLRAYKTSVRQRA